MNAEIRTKLTCFVAHNYSRSQTDDLRRTLDDIFGSRDIAVVYADNVFRSCRHIFTDKIISIILNSHICLFDITGFNPNVLLELGVAFGLPSKNFSILIRKESDERPSIPADLEGLDRIEYESFLDLKNQLEDKVLNSTIIDAIKRAGNLLKSNTNPTIYAIENNKKRPFPDPQTLIALGYRFEDVDVVAESTIESIDEGDSFDSILTSPLIRVSGTSPVWIILNGIRHHITKPEILHAISRTEMEISLITEQELEAYKKGSSIQRVS